MKAKTKKKQKITSEAKWNKLRNEKIKVSTYNCCNTITVAEQYRRYLRDN